MVLTGTNSTSKEGVLTSGAPFAAGGMAVVVVVSPVEAVGLVGPAVSSLFTSSASLLLLLVLRIISSGVESTRKLFLKAVSISAKVSESKLE